MYGAHKYGGEKDGPSFQCKSTKAVGDDEMIFDWFLVSLKLRKHVGNVACNTSSEEGGKRG